MQRFLALFLAAFLVVTLTSCGKRGNPYYEPAEGEPPVEQYSYPPQY